MVQNEKTPPTQVCICAGGAGTEKRPSFVVIAKIGNFVNPAFIESGISSQVPLRIWFGSNPGRSFAKKVLPKSGFGGIGIGQDRT